jgi:hypothetical protein
MKTTQTMSTVLSLGIAFFCLGSGFVNSSKADESFRDVFTEPDPTDPDREPVSWRLRWGGTIAVDNDDLIVQGQGLVGVVANDFNAKDVAIETQFRVLQGDYVGLAVRSKDIGDHCYYANLNRTSTYVALFTCENSIQISEGIAIDTDATQQDVVMRLQVVRDHLSLWAWSAGTIRPEEPLVTAPASEDLIDGTVGVYVSSVENGPSEAAFRYFEAAVMPSVPGDFNSDNVLDVDDIDSLSAEVRDGWHSKWFDLNDDGSVDESDHRFWVHELKNTWIGDADLNREFTSSDMVQVFEAGKYETGEDAGWAEGDWDCSGAFNSSDMVAAFADGGYERGPQMDAAAVPEPTSVLLLMAGLIAVTVFRRRLL